MPEDTQPILDYSARDFDTIRSMLVGIAQGLMPEWRTVGEANDFGTLLLEEYAFMGDVMNYYIDRVASEAFLGTAQRRQSVLYIAEQQGYSPIGQRAAIVNLTFSLDGSYTGTDPVAIPAGTRVFTSAENSADAVYFETDTTATILPTADLASSASVTATEGRTNVATVGASTGAPNQTFALAELGVVEGSLTVRTLEGTYQYGNVSSDDVTDTSNDVPRWVTWYEVPTIAAARPTQSVFSVYLDDLGYTYVLFGDAAAGRIPPSGAQIEITYRYGVGARGNSLDTNELVNLDEGGPLPVQYLTVTNPIVPVGGSDPESLSSMRFSIPKGAQIRDRAVTINDFQALANQVPGVAKAVAYGQIYSAVNIRVAPVGGAAALDNPALMANIRENVQNFLEPRILIGSKVYIEDAEWTNVWIRLDLYVLDGFDQVQTKNDVEASLRSAFAFDNMDLAEDIHIGEVYRRATRVEGVDWVDVTALNANGATSTVVENINVPFGHIGRIAPDTGADTTGDTSDDTLGIIITAFGGTDPA
jgi:Baseplate J-like protein